MLNENTFAPSPCVVQSGDAEAIKESLFDLRINHEGQMIAENLAKRLDIMLDNVEALSGAYHCVVANPS